MNAVIYEFPVNKNWQALYKAAIVEADSTKLSDRIAKAKKVIAESARELFQTSGDNFEEEQALAPLCGRWTFECKFMCLQAVLAQSEFYEGRHEV